MRYLYLAVCGLTALAVPVLSDSSVSGLDIAVLQVLFFIVGFTGYLTFD